MCIRDRSYIDYEQYNEEDTLIHLNIQENHFYITRDQLMSLPESLLLCLFPSGVFMDREGQIITNLTPEDEVFIPNFSTECFEYIMQVYNEAHNDYLNYPVNELYNRKDLNGSSGSKFFNFGTSSNNPTPSQESEVLHEKPGIIVLREDLDYYCVPQFELNYPKEFNEEDKDTLLQNLMAQIKVAAGSHLLDQQSVFLGLKSSNRAKKPAKTGSGSVSPKLGPAEQHLMDMLCSSGFVPESSWGNRYQEIDKTVISSLSLCRLANETTQEFRDMVAQAKAHYDDDQKSLSSSVTNDFSSTQKSSPQLTPTHSRSDLKRKSRLSVLTDNVRSRSRSRNRSASRQRTNDPPLLYDLVPKPEINSKLLLFWKKPARKCWWGQEHVELDMGFNASYADETLTVFADTTKIHKLKLPVTIHIRRVWTLELSIIGIQ